MTIGRKKKRTIPFSRTSGTILAGEMDQDGSKVDRLLYAGTNLNEARKRFDAAVQHRLRIRLTTRQRTRRVGAMAAIGKAGRCHIACGSESATCAT